MSGGLTALVIAVSLVLGGGLMWLLLRHERAEETAAVKRVDADLEAERAELERIEAAKSPAEVWKTQKELTDEFL